MGVSKLPEPDPKNEIDPRVERAVEDVNDPAGADRKGYSADPPSDSAEGKPPIGVVSDPDQVGQEKKPAK